MKKKIVILISVIILLAVFSRFFFLDIRPLHFDEGINYYFAEKISNGEDFQYNPSQYHGPFYYYLVALSFLIFGISEFSLRFPLAVCGALIVLLPLFFRKIKLSILFLLSPILLYYSRYSIHEVVFVLFSLICIYFITKIIQEKSLNKLPFFAISLGILFSIKETASIFLVVLFVILIINFKGIMIDKGKILISVLCFAFVYVLFFSSFFSNFAGVLDSFRGFMFWSNIGVNEHVKPFYYYLGIILKYELPLLVLCLVGIFFKGKSLLVKNCVIWFVGSLFIYSLIPYKTPWNILNITVPMIVVAGFGLKKFKFKKTILLFCVMYLGFFSVYVNFVNPTGNDLAYFHTDNDIFDLVKQIDLENSRILIIGNEVFPLPFYLREHRLFYANCSFKESYLDEYDFVIVRDFLAKDNDLLSYTLRGGKKFVVHVGNPQ